MCRLSLIRAVAGLAVTVLGALGPANAAPYQVIRWEDSGFCEVWDQAITTTPWLSTFRVMSKPIPTVDTAFGVKEQMVRQGQCKF